MAVCFRETLTFRFLSLSLFTLCACSSHHPVVLFFWYYLPSYWFYCNEWNSKLWCIILDFMLYLLYGQEKKKKLEKQSKNTTDVKQRFFSPAVFFYAVAKGCIFQFLSNFNSDAKLWAAPQCPPNTKQIQVTLFTFLSKVFKDGTTFSFFLSELYYCSSLYYILRIKLWYCFNLFVRLFSCSGTSDLVLMINSDLFHLGTMANRHPFILNPKDWVYSF